MATGFHYDIYGTIMVGFGRRAKLYTEYDQALDQYQALVFGKGLNRINLKESLRVENAILASYHATERLRGSVIAAQA